MVSCCFVLYIVSAVLLGFILLTSGGLILICCGYIDFYFPKKKRKDYNPFEKDTDNFTDESPTTLCAQLKEKEDALRRFEKQVENLQEELSRERSSLSKLSADLKLEKEEKDDALKRKRDSYKLSSQSSINNLSAIMASRLRDGNPNVVDLSDQNRPLKIGEQFSELYDNQWTDAYGAIEACHDQKMQESDIILMLLYILEHCFMHCKGKADQQLSRMKENVSNIAHQITKKATKLPEDLMQRIKEERKLFAKDELPGYDEVLAQLKEHVSQRNIQSDFPDDPALRMYVNECLKLCWLMVVQDPPMTMLLQPVGNANDEFKPYKNRGSNVAFIVWPALLLEEGGALLSKGVAEFHELHAPVFVHL